MTRPHWVHNGQDEGVREWKKDMKQGKSCHKIHQEQKKAP